MHWLVLRGPLGRKWVVSPLYSAAEGSGEEVWKDCLTEALNSRIHSRGGGVQDVLWRMGGKDLAGVI